METQKEHRLLILGSLEDLVKLTQLAVKRGVYTVVADGNDGEAKKYASKAYTLDLNDDCLLDQVIREEQIDHILTSFSEVLFEIMVRASERNHLPCFCTTEKMRCLRDKLLMKEMFNSLGIPTAPAQGLDKDKLTEKDIHIPYPCVIKPTDGWGSHGITIVHNIQEVMEQLENSMKHSFGGNTAMLESINEGYELNVISWIQNGTAHLLEFGDRETSGATETTLPHQSREVFPSVFYRKLEAQVKDYLLRVADYCGIREGPLCMQFFYHDGRITVGEVCGRFFGYSQGIIPVINGIDPNELLLNMIYDPKSNDKILKNTDRAFDHCSVAFYLLPKPGIVRDYGNVMAFCDEHADEYKVYIKPGRSTANDTWILRIYAHFDNREEADAYTKNIYENLFVPDLNGDNLAVSNTLVSYRTV